MKVCIFNVDKFVKNRSHMGQSIQEWTKENLWKAAFIIIEGIWSTSLPHVSKL